MKAIKDCEWEVVIYESINGFWWEATSHQAVSKSLINMKGYKKSESSAKSLFLKFAKLNGIKKFKII